MFLEDRAGTVIATLGAYTGRDGRGVARLNVAQTLSLQVQGAEVTLAIPNAHEQPEAEKNFHSAMRADGRPPVNVPSDPSP